MPQKINTIPHGNAKTKYLSVKDRLKSLKKPGASIRWIDCPPNPWATVRGWEKYVGFLPEVRRSGSVVKLYRPATGKKE